MGEFHLGNRHREILKAMAAQPEGSVFLPRLETLLAARIEKFVSELYDLEREGFIRRESASEVICLSYSAHSQFQITEKGIVSINGRNPDPDEA